MQAGLLMLDPFAELVVLAGHEREDKHGCVREPEGEREPRLRGVEHHRIQPRHGQRHETAPGRFGLRACDGDQHGKRRRFDGHCCSRRRGDLRPRPRRRNGVDGIGEARRHTRERAGVDHGHMRRHESRGCCLRRLPG